MVTRTLIFVNIVTFGAYYSPKRMVNMMIMQFRESRSTRGPYRTVLHVPDDVAHAKCPLTSMATAETVSPVSNTASPI